MYKHLDKFQKARRCDINNPLCLLKKANDSLRDMLIHIDHTPCQNDLIIAQSEIIMSLQFPQRHLIQCLIGPLLEPDYCTAINYRWELATPVPELRAHRRKGNHEMQVLTH